MWTTPSWTWRVAWEPTITVNAITTDPVAVVKKEIGGAHGVLVTAVSRKAFEQAVGLVRRGGTMVLNGLPPGDFPVSIFNVVLNGITIRGSIVGTRLDLKESLEFASAGKVKAIVKAEPLENINDIFRPHAQRGRSKEELSLTITLRTTRFPDRFQRLRTRPCTASSSPSDSSCSLEGNQIA